LNITVNLITDNKINDNAIAVMKIYTKKLTNTTFFGHHFSNPKKYT